MVPLLPQDHSLTNMFYFLLYSSSIISEPKWIDGSYFHLFSIINLQSKCSSLWEVCSKIRNDMSCSVQLFGFLVCKKLNSGVKSLASINSLWKEANWVLLKALTLNCKIFVLLAKNTALFVAKPNHCFIFAPYLILIK